MMLKRLIFEFHFCSYTQKSLTCSRSFPCWSNIQLNITTNIFIWNFHFQFKIAIEHFFIEILFFFHFQIVIQLLIFSEIQCFPFQVQSVKISSTIRSISKYIFLSFLFQLLEVIDNIDFFDIHLISTINKY